MSIISPNCILDDLEQVASNAKKKKTTDNNNKQTNKKKKWIALKYSGNLLSLIIYRSYILLLAVSLILTDLSWFLLLLLFLSSRNQSVGQIWKISVHSSIFQGNQSINAALSAHEFQCLWFLSDCPDVIVVFSPFLDLFRFVTHNDAPTHFQWNWSRTLL